MLAFAGGGLPSKVITLAPESQLLKQLLNPSDHNSESNTDCLILGPFLKHLFIPMPQHLLFLLLLTVKNRSLNFLLVVATKPKSKM